MKNPFRVRVDSRLIGKKKENNMLNNQFLFYSSNFCYIYRVMKISLLIEFPTRVCGITIIRVSGSSTEHFGNKENKTKPITWFLV